MTKKLGRPKGSPNVKSLEALAVQQQVEAELGDSADPLLFLLRVMMNDTKRLKVPETMLSYHQNGEVIEKPFISMDLRIKAASAAVEYLRAKRKAVEVTGMLGHAKVEALSPKDIQNILTGDPFLNEPNRGVINVRSEAAPSDPKPTGGDQES
jgi:hypothetical protein